MTSFPKEFEFTRTWRSYQAKVLRNLEPHWEDNILNIVAAPGSGKTILGLEVIRQINQPVLILAPTLAIRNQWIERLKEHFLPANYKCDWVSFDLSKPGLLTVATYQAVFSSMTGKKISEDDQLEKDFDDAGDELEVDLKKMKNDLVQVLKVAGVKLLVLDEAHHLRAEWWDRITRLRKELGECRTVSLTATPPYDVSKNEWIKYLKLCGTIDAEIEVPELVQEGTLCPHQDYVYFNLPSSAELDALQGFKLDVTKAKNDLLKNEKFMEALASHSHLLNPEDFTKEILENPEYYSSIIIILNEVKRPLPKQLMKLMGVSGLRIPSLKDQWLEILLHNCIYGDRKNFSIHEETILEIERTFKRIGAIERREVCLEGNSKLKKLVTSSVNKLESIQHIVQTEQLALGSRLKMVILSDYIREEDLFSDKTSFSRLGVVPIFENLRRNLKLKNLGILSGTVIVLPKDTRSILTEVLKERKIKSSDIKVNELGSSSDFIQVEFNSTSNHHRVQVVTELFTRGNISVLVGTRSLLGEGWDAPVVNSLILASTVGSFMMSNQMRGRAIRVDSNDTSKAANIWHLVTLDPTHREGGVDFLLMRRRFSAFLGVSFKKIAIEGGIDRLNLPELPFTKMQLDDLNKASMILASDRAGMALAWSKALATGFSKKELVEQIKTEKEMLPRLFVLKDSITTLVHQTLIWSIYACKDIIETAVSVILDSRRGLSTVIQLLFYVLVMFGIFALPGILRALFLLFKHGRIESSMTTVGESLVRGLVKIKALKSPENQLKVITAQIEDGVILCHLIGGTVFEKNLFADSMMELFSPINNPRYLIRRKSYLKTIFGRFTRGDYHAVPEVFGVKKEFAEIFYQEWSTSVGTCDLIYTRTEAGRLALLKARAYALSSNFRQKTEIVTSWT